MKLLAKAVAIVLAVLAGYAAFRVIRFMRDDGNIYERMWR